MTQRILILAANPKNSMRLRLDEEVREIENGLRRAQQRDEFEITQRWAVRVQDMRRAMLEFNPNIVHFTGHGTGEPGIMLEDKVGKAYRVQTQALTGFFELFADSVTCVLLNACFSEVQAAGIVQHIPYVIGMGDEIADATALEFTVAFYDALGAGKPVPFAFKIACNAIQMAGSEDYEVPVLLTQQGKHETADAPLAQPPAQPPLPKQSGDVPFDLKKRIIAFFLSLQTLAEKSGRQALLSATGLDPALHGQISSELTPLQFCPLMVATMLAYGTMQDGRDPLAATLTQAKIGIGQEKQRECDGLLHEYQRHRPMANIAPDAHVPEDIPAETPPQSLDNRILRALYAYFQKNPGDFELAVNDLYADVQDVRREEVQAELLRMQKDALIDHKMTTDGQSGLVWIQPRGIKIAKHLR